LVHEEDGGKMNAHIVPFGKYKGQAIEVALADRKYVDWVCAQEWFRMQFRELYAVMSGINPDTPTPEHNALQARFVRQDYLRAFVAHLQTVPADPEVDWVFALGDLPKPDDRCSCWNQRHCAVCGEYWKDYDVCRALAWASRQSEIKTSFEVRGWDVVIAEPPLAIELKPSIGDDYPAVVRQVPDKWTVVVAFDQWHATVSLEVVRAMFHQIRWVDLSEISL
jgi:uncharacterized protein (DUF3820 family)